jgi:hypothetical protein
MNSKNLPKVFVLISVIASIISGVILFQSPTDTLGTALLIIACLSISLAYISTFDEKTSKIIYQLVMIILIGFVLITAFIYIEMWGCGNIFSLFDGNRLIISSDLEITWLDELPHYYKTPGFAWGSDGDDGYGVMYPMTTGESLHFYKLTVVRLTTLEGDKFCIKRP